MLRAEVSWDAFKITEKQDEENTAGKNSIIFLFLSFLSNPRVLEAEEERRDEKRCGRLPLMLIQEEKGCNLKNSFPSNEGLS